MFERERNTLVAFMAKKSTNVARKVKAKAPLLRPESIEHIL